MKTRILRAIAAVALAQVAIPSFAHAGYVPVYGSPPYGAALTDSVTGVSATGVNDAGTAIGWVSLTEAPDLFRAVRWNASGAVELEDFGTRAADSGANFTLAWGINTAGTAIGQADKYDASGVYKGTRALRWEGSGTAFTELGNLGTDIHGITYSRAYGINNGGTVVGDATKYVSGVDKGARAVCWDASGTATELGNLGTNNNGFVQTRAYAINDAGIALGYARKYDSLGIDKGERAVRWDTSGTVIELGNLGTNKNGFVSTRAYAINDAGTAVGYAYKYDSSDVVYGSVPVRWDGSGTAATELGNLGADPDLGPRGEARAINSAGTAVGYAQKYDASGVFKGNRAVRWDGSGTAATELGYLGTVRDGVAYAGAYDINTAGTAVGYADPYDAAGNELGLRAVLWGLAARGESRFCA